jgi:(2Fe-2S) ferredoxin
MPPFMSYFSRHIFFCCNQRDGGRACCSDKNASQMRDYAKSRVKALGLSGEGKVRVNQAGCLDRCEEGPCLVVYPEAVWYTYVDQADIDEIVEEHLQHGRVVERLKM